MNKVVDKHTDKDILELEVKVKALTESVDKISKSVDKLSRVIKDKHKIKKEKNKYEIKGERYKEKYFNKDGELSKHLTIGNYIQYYFAGANTGADKCTGIIIGVDLNNDSPKDDIYTIHTAYGYIITVYGKAITYVYESILDLYSQVTKYGFNLPTYMNDKEMFAVVYWLYDDTDTMRIEVFSTRKEAEQFEDAIYKKCEDKSINVSVSIEQLDKQVTIDFALSKLNEVISNDDEIDDTDKRVCERWPNGE